MVHLPDVGQWPTWAKVGVGGIEGQRVPILLRQATTHHVHHKKKVVHVLGVCIVDVLTEK